MNNKFPTTLKNPPDYDLTITEVINNNVDTELMNEALSYTHDKDRAEAIYVKLKLQVR